VPDAHHVGEEDKLIGGHVAQQLYPAVASRDKTLKIFTRETGGSSIAGTAIAPSGSTASLTGSPTACCKGSDPGFFGV